MSVHQIESNQNGDLAGHNYILSRNKKNICNSVKSWFKQLTSDNYWADCTYHSAEADTQCTS